MERHQPAKDVSVSEFVVAVLPRGAVLGDLVFVREFVASGHETLRDAVDSIVFGCVEHLYAIPVPGRIVVLLMISDRDLQRIFLERSRGPRTVPAWSGDFEGLSAAIVTTARDESV